MESTLSKIIVILVAVVVMAAAAIGVWYVLQPKAAPSTTDNTPQTQNNGNTNSQTTPVTPSGGQQTGVPNFDAAYASILGQLPAQQAVFATVNQSTGGAGADIYALYAKDIAIAKQVSPDTKDFSIQVAASDLNGDKVAEALVYENLDGFCGSGGCPLDVYQVKNNTWVKIFSDVAAPQVAISNNATGGFADLYLVVTSGTDRKMLRYAWNGTTYQPKEIVASWNGTAFVKAQ